MSQNDFKTSEIIEPQEASPMKKLSVVGIDLGSPARRHVMDKPVGL